MDRFNPPDIHLENLHEDLVKMTETNFHCPDLMIWDAKITPDLPKLATYETDGRVFYEFDFGDIREDELDATTLAKDCPVVINKNSVNRAVHDITFRTFGLSCHTMDYIAPVEDQMGAMTPDFIDKRTRSVVVFEYTTLQSSRAEISVMSKAQDKLSKYTPGLIRRSANIKIGFYVMAVSDTYLCTNHPHMTQWMVNNLVYMFRTAMSIKHNMLVNYPGLPLKDEEMQLLHEFHARFGMDNVNPIGGLAFTQEFYDETQKMINDAKPINREAVKSGIKWAKEQALREIAREPTTVDGRVLIETNLQRFRVHKNNFLSVPFDPERHRIHMKHVVNMPFALIKPYNQTDREDVKFIGKLQHRIGMLANIGRDIDDPEFQLWRQALTKIDLQDVTRMEDEIVEEDKFIDASIPLAELHELSNRLKEHRSRYHRVRIELPEETWETMGKYGLRGKRYKHRYDNIEYRNERKRKLHPSVETSDIASFIDEAGSWLTSPIGTSFMDYELESLFQKAYDLHVKAGSNCEAFARMNLDKLSEYSRTPVALYSRWVNDIAYELTLSRRSHTKDKEFIIKKLRYFPTWLLIYNTDSSKPLFFTIGFFEADKVTETNFGWENTVFNATKTNGSFCWTKMMSVTDPKLVNPCRIEALSLVYFVTCHVMRGTDPRHKTEALTGTHAATFSMTWLIAMHGKQGAADAAVMARFIGLQGFRSWPMAPDPGPLLAKLKACTRSRLEILINLRLIQQGERVITNPYRKDDEDPRVWHNMTNWIDGGALRSPSELIDSFYVCYSIGKDKTRESNAWGKMLESIVETENLMPTENVGLGMGDKAPGDIREHEYMSSLVHDSNKKIAIFYESKFGKQYKQVFTHQLLDSMFNVDMQSITTLKASSIVTEEWLSIEYEGEYHRDKVALAVAKVAREINGARFADMLKYSYDMVMREGCLYMCVFPKDQTTGVREIYVMKITGRICQRFIERFAEILCGKDEREIITHPENKYVLTHDHLVAVDSYPVKETYGTSSDMTRWNHYYHPSKAFLVLAPHLLEELRPFFFNFLALFEHKRIMVNKTFSRNIARHVQLNTESRVVQDYHAAITLNRDSVAFRGGKMAAYCSHGFCQGILQLNSSLFHGNFMRYWQLLCQAEFNRLKKAGLLPGIVKILFTTMHSSDDASVYITVCRKDIAGSKEVGAQMCAYFATFRKHLAVLFGMKDSVKTVAHTEDFMEFNSKYTVGGITYEPLMRQIHAIAKCTEAETIIGRQQEAYNLREGLLEYTCPLSDLGMMELAQAINQYRLAGSSVSPYFPLYARLLKETPDAGLGFILLDDPRAPGMAGNRYNIWISSFHPSIESKLAYALRGSEKGFLKGKISAGLTKDGMILGTTAICFGDLKKAKALYRNAGLPDNWREVYNENPSYLFTEIDSAEKLILNVSMKMNNPTTLSSICSGSVASLINVKSSVFFTHRCVLRKKRLNAALDDAPDDDNQGKTSIIRELYDYNIGNDKLYWFDEDFSHVLTEKDRQTLFPSSESFVKHQNSMRAFDDPTSISRSYDGNSRKRVRVHVIETSATGLMSLKKTCGHKWRFLNTKAHMLEYVDSCFDSYKSKFPFLRDTWQETVEEGPFEDFVDLYGFLQAYKPDKRVLRLSAQPVPDNKGNASIQNIIETQTHMGWKLQAFASGMCMERLENRRDFDPMELSSMASEEPAGTSVQGTLDTGSRSYATEPPVPNVMQRSVNVLMHEIHCILELPMSEYCKNVFVQAAIKSAPELPIFPHLGFQRPNVLATFQMFVNKKNPADIIRGVHVCKAALIGAWTIPQRRSEDGSYHGLGTWRGRINNVPVIIRVAPFGEMTGVEFIEVERQDYIPLVLEELHRWCRQNNINTNVKPDPRIIEPYIESSVRSFTGYPKTIRWRVNPRMPFVQEGDLFHLIRRKLLRLRVVDNNIKLMVDRAVILSYMSRGSDYMVTNQNSTFFNKVFPCTHQGSMEKLLMHWINNMQLDLTDLAKLVEKCRLCSQDRVVDLNHSVRKRFIDDSEKLSIWAYNLVERALEKSGVRYTHSCSFSAMNRMCAPPEFLNEEEEDDLADALMNRNLAREAVETVLEDNAQLDELHFPEDVLQDEEIKNLAQSLETEDTVNTVIGNSHPIVHFLLSEHADCRREWDDIITNKRWAKNRPAEVALVKNLAKIEGIAWKRWGFPMEIRQPLQSIRAHAFRRPVQPETVQPVEIDYSLFED